MDTAFQIGVRSAVAWICITLLSLACCAGAYADSGLVQVLAEEDESLARRSERAWDWYYFIAAVNVYPGLRSEEIINKTLEPVLRTLSPGHDGVYTVSDLRDDHGLWPPHLGLGVNLSDKWSLFIEGGYTAGKVRTKNDRPSIFLLPLHTDFEIKRSALFGGVGLDYFPWGMAESRSYDGLGDRLLSMRPFLGTRLTWTYATFRARAKLGLKPFPNFLNLELSDAWGLPSATMVVGVDVPLTRSSTLTFNAGYNHFWDQAADFEGYAFTLQWRSYFIGPCAESHRDDNKTITRGFRDAHGETTVSIR